MYYWRLSHLQKKKLMNVSERFMLFFHLFFYSTDISVYLRIISPKKRSLRFLSVINL